MKSTVFRYSLENPRAYIEANVVGFLNVLEGCRATGVGLVLPRARDRQLDQHRRNRREDQQQQPADQPAPIAPAAKPAERQKIAE